MTEPSVAKKNPLPNKKARKCPEKFLAVADELQRIRRHVYLNAAVCEWLVRLNFKQSYGCLLTEEKVNRQVYLVKQHLYGDDVIESTNLWWPFFRDVYFFILQRKIAVKYMQPLGLSLNMANIMIELDNFFDQQQLFSLEFGIRRLQMNEKDEFNNEKQRFQHVMIGVRRLANYARYKKKFCAESIAVELEQTLLQGKINDNIGETVEEIESMAGDVVEHKPKPIHCTMCPHSYAEALLELERILYCAVLMQNFYGIGLLIKLADMLNDEDDEFFIGDLDD